MKQFSNKRVLCLFIIVLLFCQAVTALIISHKQGARLRTTAYEATADHLNLMVDASLEALIKSDYTYVQSSVKRWGASHKELHELRVVAPNGFIIAEYKNPEPAVGELYSLEKDVMIEKTKLATIYLQKDYCEVMKTAARLRNRLFLAGLIITSILGIVLWFIFRNMAIAPLEAAVKERTQALSDANQEMEQLAENSPT